MCNFLIKEQLHMGEERFTGKSIQPKGIQNKDVEWPKVH